MFIALWHIKAEIYLVGVNSADYKLLNRCNKGETIKPCNWQNLWTSVYHKTMYVNEKWRLR
jgi:hypothetical protein